jgi:hypothetical protein
VALKLIYQVFAKLLSWLVHHARSDTAEEICECRCGAPGWRTIRLGAGDPA